MPSLFSFCIGSFRLRGSNCQTQQQLGHTSTSFLCSLLFPCLRKSAVHLFTSAGSVPPTNKSKSSANKSLKDQPKDQNRSREFWVQLENHWLGKWKVFYFVIKTEETASNQQVVRLEGSSCHGIWCLGSRARYNTKQAKTADRRQSELWDLAGPVYLTCVVPFPCSLYPRGLLAIQSLLLLQKADRAFEKKKTNWFPKEESR